MRDRKNKGRKRLPNKPRKKRPDRDDRPAPRVTRTGKRFTRRQATAGELGVESVAESDGIRRYPVVAIVGRPNVGKSSLFNALAGSRIAIEDPRPGTTRDRVSTLVRLKSSDGTERVMELFDTAGIGIVDEEEVTEHVHEQIHNAIATADLVLFVADIREGTLLLDQQTASLLRRHVDNVLLLANKADDPSLDKHAGALAELGLGEPMPVSARGKRNMKELRQRICDLLPPKLEGETLDPPELLLSIVGRRNVGKSTLVNALAEDTRVIASELEGTTRDSVDVRFTYDGKTFIAIDTAGLRKRGTLQHSVEFFSQSRAIRAVRRSSVTVLMLDAREDITRIDTNLADLAMKECKPLIIAINKWDLIEGIKTGQYEEFLRKRLHAVKFAPLVFMTAKDGRNVFELLDLARDLHRQAGIRVGTGELNRLVRAAFDRHHPQPRKNKIGRIYYATQVETYPPQIVVFVNDPELFPENWRNYLLHQLQKTSPFAEIPIRLKFKAREKVVLE